MKGEVPWRFLFWLLIELASYFFKYSFWLLTYLNSYKSLKSLFQMLLPLILREEYNQLLCGVGLCLGLRVVYGIQSFGLGWLTKSSDIKYDVLGEV